MEKYIDIFDRIVKIIIGIFFFWIGYSYETWWGALGIIPLLRGLYTPFACWSNSLPSIDKDQKCK